jgi:beta-lactamase superfamily II metal-dependent hydrolase
MSRHRLSAASIAILDVGHGNSTVIIDRSGTIVIDAGPKAGLMQFLVEHGINKLDVVLLSHADQDHIEGLTALLAAREFEIGVVRMNTDSQKDTTAWDDLIYELSCLQDTGLVDFKPYIIADPTERYSRGEIDIQILAPSSYLAAKGPGSRDRMGRRIDSNSISAVIRLVHKDTPILLLTGDLDELGLDNMISRNVDARSPVLIFPHHGGKAGASTNLESFASRLCDYVKPKHVVFSIGRSNKYPRPEIVRSILSYDPTIKISCTQLSEICAALLPKR